jgi:serine/threonine-protein kinase
MPATGSVIPFIRRRDFKFLKELGQGACGQTVLLLDEQIDEHFVCKKYVPYDEAQRQQLYENFVREIKLLHRVYHTNVVRVFNYYLYPEAFSGFILMEYVEGKDISDAIKGAPETISELFLQAIAGFQHLEKENILHRDIRIGNILVRTDGILKIIDLGFGKGVKTESDFDKSISLNLWCESPKEFASKVYDFATEVYFLGKLFEVMIQENDIENFQYKSLLIRMCQRDPKNRIASFFEINKEIQNSRFAGIQFDDEEMTVYRTFANALHSHITKIETGAKYRDDIERIQIALESAYRNVMLEQEMADAGPVLRCFIMGMYYYRKRNFPVEALKGFVHLLKGSTIEQKRIIFANLHTKLSAIERYSPPDPNLDPPEDDIPF